MRVINKLNSDAFQRLFLTGNSGQRIVMDLRYLPTQQLWMADLQLDDFVLNGIVIVNSPNFLRGYHNIIPFGINCLTIDGQDPRNITDFESEYAIMCLLTPEEVQNLEANWYE